MKPSLLTIFIVCLAVSADVRAHWPDQPPHQMTQLGELTLEGGGVIPNLKISYVTHGKPNAAKDNAILFLHGFGGNHHLIDHHIGGRALDTDKYFIICPNALDATQIGYEQIDSIGGHLVCCNTDPQATRVIGDAIRAFLQELGHQRTSAK